MLTRLIRSLVTNRSYVASVIAFGVGFAVLSGCSRERDVTPPDASPRVVQPDLGDGEYVPALGCRGESCDDARPCFSALRCIDGVCLVHDGDCSSDGDCRSDSRCVRGACVAYDACERLPSYSPECRERRFPSEALVTPQLGCHFAGVNASSLPVVADLDGDGKPEVITLAAPDTILALRPASCDPLWRRSHPLLAAGLGNLAVADLDGDLRPEIVAIDREHRLVVFDANGMPLATAPIPIDEQNVYSLESWSAPSIADVDGSAPPEIIAGAQVARFIKGPPARIDILWSQRSLTTPWGSVSIAADLDGDGRPEVVTSERVHDGASGADKTPAGLRDKPFYPQIADFTGDGRPDLLLVESRDNGQVVRVFDWAAGTTRFGPYRAGAGGFGGPAVIADFDADGVPDFGLSGSRYFYAYALRCGAEPRPPGCLGHEPGLLWSKRIDDRSSGSAGPAAFDFNGDGAAELVLRDECWLRILSGFSGRTLAAYNVTSGTGIETPTIADLDGDGHAELIVTSDVDIDLFGVCARPHEPELETRTPWSGWTRGILIFGDPMKRWLPARPLWNQHAYHVSNIADDLSVPTVEPDYLRTHNSFRMSAPPVTAVKPRAQIDLTARLERVRFPRLCSDPWPLAATLCNRGAATAMEPLYATFYNGPPELGRAVCTTASAALLPGECRPISCVWSPPPMQRVDLFLRVGDDGKGGRVSGQCRDENDVSAQRNLACFDAPP